MCEVKTDNCTGNTIVKQINLHSELHVELVKIHVEGILLPDCVVIGSHCFSEPNAQLTHGSLKPANGSKTGQGEGAEAADAASVTEPVKL